MNKYIVLLNIILLLNSCFEEEPDFFSSSFYPVTEGSYENQWIKNEYFHDSVPITIRFESRLYYESMVKEGRFDSIMKNNAELYLSRDIYLLNDTIFKSTNLLNTEHADIETIMTERSGGYIPYYYIIWINKNLQIDYKRNKSYLTVYFKTTTQYNNTVNDSTVVYIGE